MVEFLNKILPAPDNCSKQNAGFSRIFLSQATALAIITSPVLTKDIGKRGRGCFEKLCVVITFINTPLKADRCLLGRL